MPQSKNLKFTFAPHILEDLGVNLYTSLPKVLVEFVANAHDADAETLRITLNEEGIMRAKETVRAQHGLDKATAAESGGSEPTPLGERALPDSITIMIEDDGHGMTLEDLETKFLVIGRRRRKGKEKLARTPRGRIIMGRKGLGKLAGFGIAHLIEVTSKVADSPNSTKIILDLDNLLSEANASPPSDENGQKQKPVDIPSEVISNDISFSKGHGTRIVLRRLVYEGLRGSILKNLEDVLAESFHGIEFKDFGISINAKPVETSGGEFAYAWPNPDEPHSTLVDGELSSGEYHSGQKFTYRIRFRRPKNQLLSRQRGIRVYAHHRLASVPDLLELKSSAHGYQYTSYMEGVVVADWIDEQKTDYISTDRQKLRWETPALAELRQFLTEQMIRALNHYADEVSNGLSAKIKEDDFTKETIDKGKLPAHRQKIAWQIAKTLAGKDGGDLDGEFYRNTLKTIVTGLGHGDILATIHQLASLEKPELQPVITEITKLTRQEFGDFLKIVEGRLKAIEALTRICDDVDFKKAKNEKELHELFKNNTWLVDPTFFEFLASNEGEGTVARRLEKELGIDEFAPASALDYSVERPDMCFLIGSESLSRFIIIEFKAPNEPLRQRHLTQLLGYMSRSKTWLKNRDYGHIKVEGILIGSKDFEEKTSDDFESLKFQLEEWNSGMNWRVWDILDVLKSAGKVHRELLNASAIAAKS